MARRSPAVTPRPLPRGMEILLLGGLLVVAAAPFLLFEYIPVEDGPAHVANAAILLQRDAPAIAAHYEWNFAVWTNLLADVLLAGLLLVLPAAVADKVMTLLLLVALPLSVRWCLVRLDAEAGWLAALSIPLAVGLLTYFGFYGFLLGVVLALCTFAWWIPRARAGRLRPGSTLGLALLMVLVFLSHPLPFLALLLMLGAHAMDVACAGDASVRRGVFRAWIRRLRPIGLATLPAFIGFAVFWSGQRGDPAYTRDLLTRLKAFPVDAVLSLSFDEVPFILAYGACLGLALLVGIGVNRSRLAGAPGFPLAAALLVAVYFLGPDAVGKGSFILPRTELFLILLVLFSLARHAPPRRIARLALAVTSVAVAGLTFVRIPLHADMDAEIREFLSGAEVVTPGSTILPVWAVPLDRLYEAGGRRIHPLSERAGYLTASRGAVDLRHFPGYEKIFPLDFAPGVGVKEWAGDSEEYREAFELGPTVVDLADFADWSPHYVDFVWLWGRRQADDERLADPAARRFLGQLDARYRLVYESAGGRLEVYASTDQR